jgi:hypothetical protein
MPLITHKGTKSCTPPGAKPSFYHTGYLEPEGSVPRSQGSAKRSLATQQSGRENRARSLDSTFRLRFTWEG